MVGCGASWPSCSDITMQGSQQRQYRRSSQSGRDPARPGKVIASAEPERQTNAARAGASGRKESRAVSPGDSTHRFCWRAPCVRYGRVPFIPLKAGSTPVTEGEARQHSFTRAGRTPGTNLSAWRCLRTNSPNHYHTRPARRVWHVAGGIPAALSISPPVPALGELPQRLRPDVSLARASARVDSQLPAAMGIAGTHAAGWDQFDGGAAMQHRSERWAQRGIARGHTKPGRVSGQEILSLPDHTEKSRPQLIANCVSRPAVKPFRPACAEADSPNRNNPC